MPSLTSILPAIAPVLELTPQALYERQRALIRLGLLAAPEGRGKVGAVASPDTVALLIVATMVTDNLSDTDDRVRRLSSAPFVDGKKDRCAFSGAIMFKEALSFVLSPTASLSRRRGGAFHDQRSRLSQRTCGADHVRHIAEVQVQRVRRARSAP